MNCTQSLRPISLNLEWCQLPACTPVLLEGLLAPSKLISIRSNSIASKGISNHLPLQCIAAVVYGCWWPAPASRCAMDSASKPFKAFRTNSKWTRMMQSKCQMNKRKNTFVLKWFEDVWRISSSTTVFRDPSLQRSSDRKLLCLAFPGWSEHLRLLTLGLAQPQSCPGSCEGRTEKPQNETHWKRLKEIQALKRSPLSVFSLHCLLHLRLHAATLQFGVALAKQPRNLQVQCICRVQQPPWITGHKPRNVTSSASSSFSLPQKMRKMQNNAKASKIFPSSVSFW